MLVAVDPGAAGVGWVEGVVHGALLVGSGVAPLVGAAGAGLDAGLITGGGAGGLALLIDGGAVGVGVGGLAGGSGVEIVDGLLDRGAGLLLLTLVPGGLLLNEGLLAAGPLGILLSGREGFVSLGESLGMADGGFDDGHVGLGVFAGCSLQGAAGDGVDEVLLAGIDAADEDAGGIGEGSGNAGGRGLLTGGGEERRWRRVAARMPDRRG